MKIVTIAAAAALALTMAACNSPQDEAAEAQADALESQAAATSNEAVETELNQKADAIEQQAGNADGGATTENTPTTNTAQ